MLGYYLYIQFFLGYAEFRMMIDSTNGMYERLMQVNYFGTVYAIKVGESQNSSLYHFCFLI